MINLDLLYGPNRPLVLVLIVVLTFLAPAALAPNVGPRTVGAVPALPAELPAGQWRTIASGDDVLALAIQGATMWAGTRAGGLVRWDTTTGDYVQFLRPQDPLGGNTVYDVDVGPDGRKWLATEGGLTMFDDRGTPERDDDEWRTYTRESTFNGLPSDDVRAVATDGERVWVGGAQVWDTEAEAWAGGGLGRLDTKGTPRTDDDTWAAVATYESTVKQAPDGTTSLGLVSDYINDILVMPDGNLWIATSPYWQIEEAANPADPDVWVQAHGGLSYLDTAGTPDLGDDSWAGLSCETSQFTVKCPVRMLALDRLGWVWAAVGGRGAIAFVGKQGRFTDERWRIYSPGGGTIGSFVQSIAFGPADIPELANTVWLATSNGGVSVVDHKGTLRNHMDDDWQLGRAGPFTRSDGLARNRTQAIQMAGGEAWIGTGPEYGIPGGISRLDLVDFTFGDALVTDRSPLTNFITDIDFGTPGSRWEGHTWITTGSRSERLFGAGAVDLDTRGTRRTDDDEWTRHTKRSTDADQQPPWTGLAGNNVQAVAIQGDLVWLGSTETIWNGQAKKYEDGGLSVFDGTSWTARTVDNTGGAEAGLRHGSVSSVAVGCDNELWVGTGNRWDAQGAGVDVLTPGASVHVRTQDTWEAHGYPQLASNNTTAIAVDCAARHVAVSAEHHMTLPAGGSPGGKWQGGGVAIRDLDAGTWTRHDTTNGLESFRAEGLNAEAETVAVGSDGTVMVGTYGTHDMSTADLVSQKPFWPAVLNTWDGSVWRHDIFARGGWVSSVAEDGDGRLWVATSRGGAARESATPENWRVDRELSGLHVYDSEVWRALDVASVGLPANDISVVKVAPDGDIWIGTEGWGLAQFQIGEAVPTQTPTSDAPSPTPTDTPTSTSTPTKGPSPTATATRTPTRPWPTITPAPGDIYLPWAEVRHR